MAGRISKLKTQVQTRLDAWQSALTGIGGLKDKRSSYWFRPEPPLPFLKAEELYNSNDLAARICDAYPEEALSEGIEIKVATGDEVDSEAGAELETKFHDRLKALNAMQFATDAAVWGRVHGDAWILPVVEDGLDLKEPLDFARVKQVKFLRQLEHSYVSVLTKYMNLTDPKFFEPELYTVTIGGVAQIVHESRLMKFRGARTSMREQRQLNGFHYSVLHRIQLVLRDFGIGWDSAALLLSNSTQGVYRLNGLMDAIASDDGARLLEKRIEIIDMMRSVAKSIALDKEEEFTYQNASFTGVPDLLDRFASRLSAASGIPVTLLMGESPAGLNATGKADLQIWYKRVSAYARNELRPPMELLLSCIAAELGVAPEDWSFEFCPPGKPTEAETADLRLKVAQADKIYIDAQVVIPEEIAINRFAPEGYSMETSIDLELRQKIIDEEAKQDPADIVEQRLAPPPAPTQPGADPTATDGPAPKAE